MAVTRIPSTAEYRDSTNSSVDIKVVDFKASADFSSEEVIYLAMARNGGHFPG
jgi:hypothetical protein